MTHANGQHDRPRDISHERSVTMIAAAAVGGNATRLIALAEARVLDEPIREFFLRDRTQDGLEEGADWRNYLCWQLLLIDLVLSSSRDPRARYARAAAHRCLGLVVLAFEEQQTVARLLAELADFPLSRTLDTD